jgi:uncharacterized protein (TIGR00725 family)
MTHKSIIGIMGPGEEAQDEDIRLAYRIGKIVAEKGFVLLTGGRDKGVMEASMKGAREAGGITVGILPGNNSSGTSRFVDIAIYSGMGNARNNINVLSSTLILSIGEGPGTFSEIALAIKAGKQVLSYNLSENAKATFQKFSDTFLSFDKFDEEELNNYLQRML